MLFIALQREAPYNFPPELRAPWVARALSEHTWTFDGQPYARLWFDGSCDDGGDRCDLTVTGLPGFVPTVETRDTYYVEAHLGRGLLRPGARDLRGFPPELLTKLDEAVRALDREGRLNGMSLRGAGWSPPPPDDAFVLRYGQGDLEGERVLYVTLDRANREILSITQE